MSGRPPGVPEFAVCGARGRVASVDALVRSLSQVVRATGVSVQAMRPDAIHSPAQIESAVHHAVRAFREGRNQSLDVGLEVLRYAAGERQISRALEKLGVRDGDETVLLVAVGTDAGTVLAQCLADLGLRRDDALLGGGEERLIALGVTKQEMDVMPPDRRHLLALERVALVDVAK